MWSYGVWFGIDRISCNFGVLRGNFLVRLVGFEIVRVWCLILFSVCSGLGLGSLLFSEFGVLGLW